MMKESAFQASLIKEIRQRLNGAIVLKNDPNYLQGIPDILVLYGDRWASLECKRSATAPHRPNQDYYIGKMDDMSFSKFICPENKEEILDEMERSLKSQRSARDPLTK